MKYSIGKLHIQWGRQKFDVEKAVGKYLLELPRCTSQVVLMTPEYGFTGWLCDVIANSTTFYEWSAHMAKARAIAHPVELQAINLAFPLWLGCADNDDESLSRIPHSFAKLNDAYIPKLVDNKIAWLFCSECVETVQKITKEKNRDKAKGYPPADIHKWYCKKGHLLRNERIEIPCF